MRLNRKKKRKLKGNVTGSKPRHVITLEGDLRKEVPPSIQCTCGWVEGPDSNLMKLGLAGKQHAIDNPGHFFRSHDA